jgi:hypothetical protein
MLSPRPLVGFRWRRGLWVQGWLWGRRRFQLSPALSAADQGAGREEICPSRWRAGRPLLLWLVREVNCRHRPDIIGRYLSSKERVNMGRDKAGGQRR